MYPRGTCSSVLDRKSFVFDPNVKIKKRKFTDFSALSFCNEQNSLAPLVKKLKSSKCAMVSFFRLFSCVFDRISCIFYPNIKTQKRKFAHFSVLSFCRAFQLSQDENRTSLFQIVEK